MKVEEKCKFCNGFCSARCEAMLRLVNAPKTEEDQLFLEVGGALERLPELVAAGAVTVSSSYSSQVIGRKNMKNDGIFHAHYIGSRLLSDTNRMCCLSRILLVLLY